MKIERHKKKGDLILELTPLIDVVFLLLIFFLVATSFEDVKAGIKIDLPQSTIREISDVKEIQIIVDRDKNMLLHFKQKGKSEQIPVNKSTLKSKLSEKLENTQDKNVIISADKRIDYGYIVDIMTISKEAGAQSLDINTSNQK